MSNYPQIHVPQKYQEFLKKLAGVGKPTVVDQGFIKKLGFKSSYDEKFLSAIKFIGLVEDKRNGTPTDTWSKLRSNFGETLASGLLTGYADVFSFYPDAHLRDEEALTNYFRGNSDEDSDAVTRMVNAFVAVRELASFGDAEVKEENAVVETDVIDETLNSGTVRNLASNSKNSSHPQVNLNIQLQLPADASGEIYDKFFEAMKKHNLI